MHSSNPPDWAAIRAAYEANRVPVAQIVAEHGISRWRLHEQMRRENWTRRQRRQVSARAMVRRLLAVLDDRIGRLEDAGGEVAQDAATLNTMARTLEKLIALEGQQEKKKPDPKRRREIEELRQKLAARIDQLRQQ